MPHTMKENCPHGTHYEGELSTCHTHYEGELSTCHKL